MVNWLIMAKVSTSNPRWLKYKGVVPITRSVSYGGRCYLLTSSNMSGGLVSSSQAIFALFFSPPERPRVMLSPISIERITGQGKQQGSRIIQGRGISSSMAFSRLM